MDLSQHLTDQLKDMDRLVDSKSGAILFRHPTLRGLPDLVVEGDGYTLEFIGPTLLWQGRAYRPNCFAPA